MFRVSGPNLGPNVPQNWGHIPFYTSINPIEVCEPYPLEAHLVPKEGTHYTKRMCLAEAELSSAHRSHFVCLRVLVVGFATQMEIKGLLRV